MKYTWQQVAQHNTKASSWVIIHGKVYDITAWLEKHPGGSELLLLHVGRECTDTFITYHPFTNKPRDVLKKYEIGELTGADEFPQYKPDSRFYQTCRERVGAYFQKNKLNSKNPWPGIYRMAIVACFAWLMFMLAFGSAQTNIPWPMQYLCAIGFGICQGLPLLHIMHDSSHAAFSTVYSARSFFGYFAMDWFAGGSLISWYNQHVVGHHIYTNVAGTDPDLPMDFKSDIRRIVSRQIFQPMYQWQHIYLPPLYGLLVLKVRIQDFTHTFMAQTNGPMRVNPHSIQTWALLLCSKAFWCLFRIWYPLVYVGMDQVLFWTLFFVAELVTGWYLAFNFQVSHISTECDYPAGESQVSAIQEEWAISQVRSSVDYAHGSTWVTFFSGALNYQVTHPLFPCVSQYHYPKIAPIIQQVCQEYGVKYTVLPSFFSAFKAHISHLRTMGQRGQPVSIHMG